MRALKIQGIKMQAVLIQCIIFSVSAIQHACLFQKHLSLISSINANGDAIDKLTG